jgi:multidrug efflux pump subunit AcrB
MISAFVSLTLTPVLNMFLRGKTQHAKFHNQSEPFFAGIYSK